LKINFADENLLRLSPSQTRPLEPQFDSSKVPQFYFANSGYLGKNVQNITGESPTWDSSTFREWSHKVHPQF